MSMCDRHGVQIHPDDYQPVIVHYTEHMTSRSTVGQIAERLGITPDTVRENLAELVRRGALVPCGPDEYDMQGAAQ